MQETLLVVSHSFRNKNSPNIMKDNSKSLLFSMNDTTKHYINNCTDKKNNKSKKQEDKYCDLKSEDSFKRESINNIEKMKNLQENCPKNCLQKPFVNYCSESPKIWREEKNKIEGEIGDFQEKTSEEICSQSHLDYLHNFGTSGKSNLSTDDFPGEPKSMKVNNYVVDENYNMTEYLNKIKQIYLQKEDMIKKVPLEEIGSHNPSNNPLKKCPFLLNDECRCVNPEISHACIFRMPNDDSFGILNPMFEETDPENSPKLLLKHFSKTRSKTKGLQRAQSSTLSDASRTPSFCSLAEFKFKQRSAELDSGGNSTRTTRSKTYSDFISALSQVDSDANYSYFYPNDLREEIMFPLPDSLQKGVFRNPNAKEAPFSIGKPQRKKRVKPLKIEIPEVDEHELLKDIEALNGIPHSILGHKSLTVSDLSPPSSLKFCGVESQSSFESQDLDDGDNFGRNEYLEYKASSDNSRRNSDFSNHSEEHKESVVSYAHEDFPNIRFSSVGSPEALHRTLAGVDLEISLRKLSLPYAPHTDAFDISSIYVEDIQSSLNQIYQPLPTAIFGCKERISYDNSSLTEDFEQNSINQKASPKKQMKKIKVEYRQEATEIDSSTHITKAHLNQSYSSMKADKNFPITDLQNSGLNSETSISPTNSPSNFGKSIYSELEEKPISDEVSDNKESANSVSNSLLGNEIQDISSFMEKEENIQTGARRKRREGVSAATNCFPALDLDLIPDQPSSSLALENYSKLSLSFSSDKSFPRSPLHSLASSRSSIVSTSSSSLSSSSSSSRLWSESSSESSLSSNSKDNLL